MCFCYIWKDKSLLILNLFTSEYLDQIPLWKEIKEIFSVKLQTENLFLFKIIIKTHASQIRDIMLGNKFGLFQIQLEGVWGRYSYKNILKLLPTCKLETVFPALKLTQNCFTMFIFLFLKTGNLIIYQVPLSPSKYCA